MINNTEDYAFWMALAHLPRWRTERINRLILEILDNRKISLSEFFELAPDDWQQDFGLNEKESEDLKAAKAEFPDYVSLIEKLLQYEIDLIPYVSERYPPTLKRNLQIKYSPPLLYTKGDPKLLHEPAVAIIGSRKASQRSLEFTRNVAQRCAENFEVVVSGFAKGVDRTALDETLNANGRSIIVLPQGILTFSSGFKRYYEPIIAGDVLVCSNYHPKSRWNAGLAMGRNVYIYGLAEKIYVAESNFEGGTWSGVIDGLKKGRIIYVRKPEANEKNANAHLIEKGATPVDMHGNPFKESSTQDREPKMEEKPVQYDLFGKKE
jgi:DNA processing protein